MELRPIKAVSPQTQATRWNVLLLAGDRPGGDPLAGAFGVESKSLVPLAGKPLLAHVLETLLSHPRVNAVFVLAQNPEQLFENPAIKPFRPDPRIRLATSSGGIAASLAAALQLHRLDWPVAVTTSDHVLLDERTLDWFFDHANDCDVAVGMVDRQVAATEELDAGRTWVRFRDVDITGANLFALNSPLVFSALEYWQSLEAHRKRPWRMAWELGPLLLLKFLLRRFSLVEAFEAVGHKLSLEARAVRIPYAHAGVDVDKLADHVLVESLLYQRRK